MKNLINLIKLFDKNGIDVFVKQRESKNNLEKRLFYLILEKGEIDDDEIGRLLYNNKYKKSAIKMLKKRLKNKLIENLYQLPNPLPNDKAHQYIYKAHHYFTYGNLLVNKGEYEIGRELLNLAILNAKEAELPEISIVAFHKLLVLELVKGDEKKFIETHNAALLKILEYYIKLEIYGYYQRICIKYSSSFPQLTKFAQEISNNILANDLYLKEFNNPMIINYQFKLKLLNAKVNKNINLGFTIIEEMKNQLEKFSYKKEDELYYIELYKAELLLQFNKNNEALEILNNLNKNYNFNTFNKHSFYELKVSSHFRALEIDNVAETLVQWKDYSKKYMANVYIEEKVALYILNLYIYNLFRPNHKISKILSNLDIKRFLSSLNNIENINKDKTGYYISMLLLSILYSFSANDDINLTEKLSAIKQFSYRKIKNTFGLERKFKFIELILLFIKMEYNISSDLKIKYENFIKLPETGIDYDFTEIIPYNTIWSLILEKSEKSI
jgi:hypothetical protein